MFDSLISWMVTSLRADVPAVSNRVVAVGGYQNPRLPRISVGDEVGMSEETAFIGDFQTSTVSGNIVNLVIPIHIYTKNTKSRNSIKDDVVKSLLTTHRKTSSGVNILDIKPVGVNNLNEVDDEGKPQVWHTILDFEIMYEREETI